MSVLFEPPPSDRELSEEIVRLELGRQFPHLELQVIQHLGSGWEYDVYLVDGYLVARFPRYAEVAKNLDRAERLLEFVGSEIGSSVMVPRIILRGEPGPHFPHPFFGHRLIPGSPASDLPDSPPAALAADLGSALTAIHGLSTDSSPELDLGSQKWDCHSSFGALVEVIEAVPEISRLVPTASEWVRDSTVLPEEYDGPPRFIHDDLQPEHIIVRPESGRLSGIIDWGAALGDPAQDFSFLVAWGGWEFTQRVLDAYDGDVAPGFMERLLFLGRVRAIGWLAYEVRKGLPTDRTERVVGSLL